jgi:death on curing protein
MRALTTSDVEYIALVLARQWMEWDEPIPDFELRQPGRLEACLAAPFQTFDGQELYPRSIDKIAALFYFMIKDHPFENGNKRLAVTAMLVALHTDNRWLDVGPNELYEFAKIIASSPASHKDEVMGIITDFLSGHLISWP